MIDDLLFDALAYSLSRQPIIIANHKAEHIKKHAKVIYQDDVTVLKTNGKVYTSKPEKGDKFDPEKGLLVCLVKALGLTTSDVLDLYGRAVTKKSKRKANIIKQDKKKK